MTRRAAIITALFGGVVIVTVLTFTLVATASTVTFDLSFTTDPDVGVSGPPGSLLVVGTTEVPPEAQGRSCDVVVDVHNNESRRQGTDLVIGPLTVSNVEATKGDAPPRNVGKMIVGDTVSVSIRFGPKGEASVGATLHFTCPEPPTPTTVPPPPTVHRAPAPEPPVTITPRTAG